MKVNRDSNSYTVLYASLMVVLVAVLLAFTATSLKPEQEKNESIDKMQQILRAINQPEENASKVVESYKKYIKKELAVSISNGEVVESFEGDKIGDNDAFRINSRFNLKAIKKGELNSETDKLPVFLAEVDGKEYYVLALGGNGLWDAIWGYISVDAADHSTIFGADFGNKGETPGLGAEISTPAFSEQFKGKHLFREGQFTSIAVVKKGHDDPEKDSVDGISGGTLTSNGVNDMLKESISPLVKFLETYNPKQ